MKMKLYLLTRIGGIGPNELAQVVVRAWSVRDARHLAASQCGDEGKDTWLSSVEVDCLELTADSVQARVICRDFYTGQGAKT